MLHVWYTAQKVYRAERDIAQFQIDGLLLKFLTNYLKDRKQCVVIGGSKSNTKPVTSGVPQGSILGPLFFVLFINDMVDCLSEGTNVLLYADDTKIWRQISSWDDHVILQKDIDALFQWSIVNKMTFHPHKCKVLSVTLNHSVEEYTLPFEKFYYCLDKTQADSTLIDFVEEEKDLGVIITNRLSWVQQSLALYSKTNSRLGLVKRVCHFTKCEKQKRVLYLAMVRSLFEHASVIWHPSDVQVKKLEKIQKKSVKWILNEQDHHYNSYEYLKRLFDLKILPLTSKFIFTDLLLFHKIFYDNSFIKMPNYITHVTVEDIQRLRSSRLDRLSLKCTLLPRVQVFIDSFFHRTYLSWNRLPLSVRMLTDSTSFHNELEALLWRDLLESLDSDDNENYMSDVT